MSKCKFKIVGIDKNHSGISASAVVTPSDENKKFFTGVPSGSLRITSVNKDHLEGLAIGDEIVITIEKAVKAEKSKK